jgi:hypothetical protein
MRIAILSDAIYPFHHGGKETLQYERAVRLAQRGHAVRVHTMHWWRERHRETVRDGVAFDALAPRVPLYTAKGARSTSSRSHPSSPPGSPAAGATGR